jgi:hypothetical protein
MPDFFIDGELKLTIPFMRAADLDFDDVGDGSTFEIRENDAGWFVAAINGAFAFLYGDAMLFRAHQLYVAGDGDPKNFIPVADMLARFCIDGCPMLFPDDRERVADRQIVSRRRPAPGLRQVSALPARADLGILQVIHGRRAR